MNRKIIRQWTPAAYEACRQYIERWQAIAQESTGRPGIGNEQPEEFMRQHAFEVGQRRHFGTPGTLILPVHIDIRGVWCISERQRGILKQLCCATAELPAEFLQLDLDKVLAQGGGLQADHTFTI